MYHFACCFNIDKKNGIVPPQQNHQSHQLQPQTSQSATITAGCTQSLLRRNNPLLTNHSEYTKCKDDEEHMASLDCASFAFTTREVKKRKEKNSTRKGLYRYYSPERRTSNITAGCGVSQIPVTEVSKIPLDRYQNQLINK